MITKYIHEIFSTIELLISLLKAKTLVGDLIEPEVC